MITEEETVVEEEDSVRIIKCTWEVLRLREQYGDKCRWPGGVTQPTTRKEMLLQCYRYKGQSFIKNKQAYTYINTHIHIHVHVHIHIYLFILLWPSWEELQEDTQCLMSCSTSPAWFPIKGLRT